MCAYNTVLCVCLLFSCCCCCYCCYFICERINIRKRVRMQKFRICFSHSTKASTQIFHLENVCKWEKKHTSQWNVKKDWNLCVQYDMFCTLAFLFAASVSSILIAWCTLAKIASLNTNNSNKKYHTEPEINAWNRSETVKVEHGTSSAR